MSTTVSIHPYFQPHEGKLDEVLAILPVLTALATTEDTCLWYDFSLSEEGVLFCREAYVGAAGLLAHVENVGEVIGKLLEVSDLIRCEIHGPAEELERLKEPMADLNPVYFAFQGGIGKP